MIRFLGNENKIILAYLQDQDSSTNYLLTAFEEEEEEDFSITLKNTYHLARHQLLTDNASTDDQKKFDDEEWAYFLFAIAHGDYFRVINGTITKKVDIYIHKSVQILNKFFVVDGNVPIFDKIEELIQEDVYIGGENPNAISAQQFLTLTSKFPNSYEKKKYVNARVATVLREYFTTTVDAELSYHQYLNKKVSRKDSDLIEVVKELDLHKYRIILNRLKDMLQNLSSYNENQWQEQILQIILLMYPKYIYVFSEVKVIGAKSETRFLDYLLVDSNGYADIIEIKKPFDSCIMTNRKYRDNHIPLQELSGTIMQMEKYLFALNRWGPATEKMLNEKYRDKIPQGFQIKIVNPSGFIIMGRENNLSSDQKADFEIVKRKFKNVVDIITYDNLIMRLNTTITKLEEH